MLKFADSHIHLDDALYGSESELLAHITEAKALGIEQFLIPGTTLSTIPRLVRYAGGIEGAYFALGLHPWFMAEHGEDEEAIEQALVELEKAVIREKPQAIGECGLDFMVEFRDRPREEALQKRLFIGQVQLAKRYNLPLIIHTRKSLDATLKILRQQGQKRPLRGVLHSVNGSLQQLEQALELGLYLGFGGASTYPRAQNLHRLLKATPLDRLLIETDGPYQKSRHLAKGATHLPKNLYNIAKDIATLRDEPLETIAAASVDNLQRLLTLEME